TAQKSRAACKRPPDENRMHRQLLYVGIIGSARSGSARTLINAGTCRTAVYRNIGITVVLVVRIFVPVVPDHGLRLTSLAVGIHDARHLRILYRAVLDASRAASRNTARIEFGPYKYTCTYRGTTAPRIDKLRIEYPAVH